MVSTVYFISEQDGGLATVDIIGYHNKREFDKRSDLTFVMGEGRDHNLPSGLETALEKMKRNEKAHITLNTKYNFGKLGCPAFGIQPNDQFSLTYEVSGKYFAIVLDIIFFLSPYLLGHPD